MRNCNGGSKHEASLERRCDCCCARDCRTGLGAAYRTGRGRPRPKSTAPGRARSLLAVVQSATVVRNAISRKGFAGDGAAAGDGPRNGSCARGNHIGDATDAQACAGFNAPRRNEGTSSVGNDRNHGEPAEPGRVGPPPGGQLLRAAGSAATWRDATGKVETFRAFEQMTRGALGLPLRPRAARSGDAIGKRIEVSAICGAPRRYCVDRASISGAARD